MRVGSLALLMGVVLATVVAACGGGSSGEGSLMLGPGGSTSHDSGTASHDATTVPSEAGSGGDVGVGVDAGAVAAAVGLTAEQGLAQVGNCMSYSFFQSSGTDLLPQAETVNSGDCGGCHNMGDGSFWASYGIVGGVDQTMLMFQKTQTMPYLSMWISPVINDGVFVDLQASGAIANQSINAGSCVPSTSNSNWCHPQFQLDPDLETAISDFVTDTLTRWHAQMCTTDGGVSDAGMSDAADGE